MQDQGGETPRAAPCSDKTHSRASILSKTSFFKKANKKIDRIKTSLGSGSVETSEYLLNNLQRNHETIDEKKERCVKVVNFIFNYRQDQEAALNQRNEKERKEKELLEAQSKIHQLEEQSDNADRPYLSSSVIASLVSGKPGTTKSTRRSRMSQI